MISSYQNGGNGGDRGNGKGPGGNGSGNGGGPGKQHVFILLMASLLVLFVVSFFMRGMTGSTTREITYTEFLDLLEKDKIAEVVIMSDQLKITPVNAEQTQNSLYAYTSPTITFFTGKAEDDTTITKRLLDKGVMVSGYVPDSSSTIISLLLTYVLPIVLMWVLLSFLFQRMGRGGGPFGVGKSNAKVYVQKETGITFKDVAGEDEAKESVVEMVDFLHNPGKYARIGAKLPKGALLVGPPGTGKTLLAKAVAGEAGVPFFSLTGSDFVELYVGVGASRVRDLFREAEKNAPCIIFIDEIDAIGRSRDSKYGGGNEEREQTLNQLLSEMDGFDGKKGIIILAATNRPEILDKALLRPGRFDRRIIVEKPDLKGRVEILKVHSKDVLMDETVDLDAIALATSGAVGSDLANMINEAAINAVKEGRNYVSQKDLFGAVEVVLVGKEKKDRILSKEERRIVSYHEVGHALVSAVQKNSEPVQKITIVPRTMGALGYVMQVPEEEKYLNTKDELHDMIVGLLAGRASEDIVFDTVTTGAANDIEKATSIARNMVTRYGMSKRFGLMGLATVESQYLEGRSSMVCADRTEADVDEEVMKILKDCYKEAKQILKDNRNVMDKLADFLIQKETITGKEFMEIFRKEKGIPEPEEQEKPKADTQTEGKDTSGDRGGYPQGSVTPAGYPQGNVSPAGYPLGSVPPAGFPRGSVPPTGYPQRNVPPAGYPQGSVPPTGYPRGSVPPAGYPQRNVPPTGYPQGSIPPTGYPRGNVPPAGHPQGSTPTGGYLNGNIPGSGSYPPVGSYPTGDPGRVSGGEEGAAAAGPDTKAGDAVKVDDTHRTRSDGAPDEDSGDTGGVFSGSKRGEL